MSDEIDISAVSLVLGMSYALNGMLLNLIPESSDKEEMKIKLMEINTLINKIYYQDKK